MKERGSFGDISLGITGKIEPKGQEISNKLPGTTTNNLLPNMENSTEDSRQNVVASSPNVKPGDFFQHLSSASASIKDTSITTTINNGDLRKPSVAAEADPAQLTIFYAGHVLVYNDFPADKVKEIMELAKQGSSSINNASIGNDRINNPASGNPVVPDLNVPSTSGNEHNTQLHHIERIARRASLHRFFAKRKDRVAAKAPYQVNHHNGGLHPPKPEDVNLLPEEGQSSRGVNHEASKQLIPEPNDHLENAMQEEGQCSKHLDLRL